MVLPLEERLKIYSIIQMTSASISMLASLTIMFMIFRSHKKLSTPLHRLLLGLSISDLIASFALSFASTLSPKDHIGWNTSGNMTLCRTQGFMYAWGQNASPMYNCSLCIYYLIEIKYTSLREYLAKIEISLHVIPVLLSLILSIIILSIDEFQPNATNCNVAAVTPFECRFDPEVDCEGGLKDHMVISILWMTQSMVVVPLTIFISMIMLYREVSAQEERSNQHRFSFTNRGSSAAYRNKVAARNRALAYSLAWLLSWSTTFIGVVFTFIRVEGRVEGLKPLPLMLVHFCLFPSQGLFNFIVYIFPKVTRRINQYKRENVVNPKRFMLAFRDTIMSRGVVLLRSSRTSPRLLNQNQAILLKSSSTRQSLQASSGPGHVNLSHEEAETQSSRGLCVGSPTDRTGVLVQEEEKEAAEETINTTMIEQGGAVCRLEESELGTC